VKIYDREAPVAIVSHGTRVRSGRSGTTSRGVSGAFFFDTDSALAIQIATPTGATMMGIVK
jgi:hypothetical protein